MPKFFKFVILLLTFAPVAMAQTRPATDSLVFTEFQSQLLAEKRRLIIHLPLNYSKEPTKKYPVMYVLDGGSQDVHTSDKIAVLAAAELIPECIVVGILNTKTSRNRDQTPPFMQTETDDAKSPNGEGDRFLAFIEKEVIPKIDSNYRTTNYRTLSGHSRGGLFVLYSLMAKPELFNARFCHSTPAWRFNDLLIKQVDSFLKSKKLQTKTFLFLSAGADETDNIKGGLARLATVLKTRRNSALTWFSYLTPLANHQQNPLIATSKGLALWGKYVSSIND
jgi:predicted alpha/beta superfamily hydrolase